MRPVAFLLVVLLALTVPVGAQEDGPLLEDPAGDVVVRTGPAGEVDSPGAADRVDIRSLHLVETPASLEVSLGLASLATDAQVTHRTDVGFTYAGVDYAVLGQAAIGFDGYFAYLAIREEDGRFSYVRSIETRVDEPAATVHFTVPREDLVGADGAPLVPGRSLTGIHVLSVGDETGRTRISGQDVQHAAFVDEAGGDATLPVLLGVLQEGHAHLHSETPYRSSNGAATTFVYHVEARNTGEDEDRFTLALEGTPSGWDVTLPVDRLTLEGGDSRSVPVVVRTPFVHQHGSSQAFLLTMTSDTDPGSVGRIQLGVRYPEIPQPAGHHDTLWMHGLPGPDDPLSLFVTAVNEAIAGRNWDDLVLMNTLEEETRFEPTPVAAYACGTHGNGTSPLAPTYCWDVLLDPGLDMGLDFDLGRTGRVEVPVHALVPTNGARLGGSLLWLGPLEEQDGGGFVSYTRQTIELARLKDGTTADIAADGQALLEATVVPLPEADLVRYQEGASLLLRLELETDRADYVLLGPHQDPELMPGGFVTLPLNEYADPVDDVFTGASNLRLDAITPQERLLNPGDTAVFTVDVVHRGDGKETYTARVVGGNVEWAVLLGPTTFTLGPNGTQRLAVSVLAPDDARDGDQADLVLEVSSTRDLSARALVRLVAVVDTDEEHPDDAEQAKALARKADKKSPGAGAAATMLALAGLAVAARAGRDPRRRT